MAETLVARLKIALDADCTNGARSGAFLPVSLDVPPVDRTDRLLSLLRIYDLHTAPLQRLGARACWAGHPAIAAVKHRLEREWLAELESASRSLIAEADAVVAIRSLAAKDRLPPVYRWIAKQASLDDLRHFLAVEGGPDGGFDDLVALCQVGLAGAPEDGNGAQLLG